MKNSDSRDKTSFANQITVSRSNAGSGVIRIHSASGFTLIELMVSLTLGLIVVAAAIQLFITGMTSYKLQKAMSHIQDSASLGLNFIIDDIRKANLSAPVPAINGQIKYAGILLTTNNIGENIDLNCIACFDAGTDKSVKSFGKANLKGDEKNDQLLIRYQAPQAGFDCSGKSVEKGTFVIQRYYVDEQSRHSLRCQAAQYTQEKLDEAKEKKQLLELGLELKDSQVILPNVDYFLVRYGWMEGGLNDKNSKIQYGTLDDYSKQSIKKNIDGVLQKVQPHIHAIQIGVIVQSADTAGHQSVVKDRNKRAFQVLGRNVELDEKYQDGYLRQAVSQTIALRNAMGWVEEGCAGTGCTGITATGEGGK